MKIRDLVVEIYIFLIKLKAHIKAMSEDDFNKVLVDKNIDYTQRLYLLYFRYF
jgi:hypothetical protein